MKVEVFTKLLSQVKDFINAEVNKINKRFDTLPDFAQFEKKGAYDEGLAKLSIGIEEFKKLRKNEVIITKAEFDKLNKRLDTKSSFKDTLANQSQIISELKEKLKHNEAGTNIVKQQLKEIKSEIKYNSEDVISVSTSVDELKYKFKSVKEKRSLADKNLAAFSETLDEKIQITIDNVKEVNERLGKDIEETKAYYSSLPTKEEVNQIELTLLSKLDIQNDNIEGIYTECTERTEEAGNNIFDSVDDRIERVSDKLTISQQQTMADLNVKIDSKLNVLKGDKGDTGAVGATGEAGMDGKSIRFNPKGKFIKENEYKENDLVIFDEQTFLVVKDTQNKGIPSDSFVLLIPRGKPGKRGPMGEQGITGKDGKDGKDGETVSQDELEDMTIIAGDKHG